MLCENKHSLTQIFMKDELKRFQSIEIQSFKGSQEYLVSGLSLQSILTQTESNVFGTLLKDVWPYIYQISPVVEILRLIQATCFSVLPNSEFKLSFVQIKMMSPHPSPSGLSGQLSIYLLEQCFTPHPLFPSPTSIQSNV